MKKHKDFSSHIIPTASTASLALWLAGLATIAPAAGSDLSMNRRCVTPTFQLARPVEYFVGSPQRSARPLLHSARALAGKPALRPSPAVQETKARTPTQAMLSPPSLIRLTSDAAKAAVAADVSPLHPPSPEPLVPPPGFGVRQSSGALEDVDGRERQRTGALQDAPAPNSPAHSPAARPLSEVGTPQETTPAAVVAPPGEPPLWIVVLREDAPLDDFLAEHGIVPRMVYRGINGFAAPLADTTRGVLQAQESLGDGGEKDINHKV